MKNFMKFAAGLAMVLGLSSTAAAAPFTGSFSIASVFTPGAGGVIPVDALGTATSLDLATALDFTTTGVATPGVDGAFNVNSANGSFLPIGGLNGTIKDFTFSGPGAASYPVTPLTAFQFVGGLTVDLTSVSVMMQNSSSLVLSGNVLFKGLGYDDTKGTFTFTANAAGNPATFSFSASQAVPEPVSTVLLGLGLLGAGVAARRRR